MEQFVKYIPYIVVFIIGGLYAIYIAKTEPSKIKEWLIDACAKAEEYLGSGTGELKLRFVYNMFVKQYPIFSKFISFDTFQNWVELALKEFKRILSESEQAQAFFGIKTESEDNEKE